jgi:peptidoglycan/xylan/chitin deacetylase (PgdA/CDA1 family)
MRGPSASGRRPVFEATEPSLFLDYFRVPYTPLAADVPRWPTLRPDHPLQTCGLIGHPAGGEPERRLCWATREALAARRIAPSATQLGSIPLFAALLGDELAADWLSEAPGRWVTRLAALDAHGRRVASIWQDEESGSIFLPFDPAEAIHAYWSERYKAVGASTMTRLRKLAGAAYYRLRPAIPRRLQIALRRLVSKVQARSQFPRWPLEPGLHDLYELLFGLLGELGQGPIPWIAPWPHDYSWALVLTHDVETKQGYEHLDLLRHVELAHGHRSSWNFVAGRYAVEDQVVRRLADEGFEIGVHGLYHDGRDLEPSVVGDRLPAMRTAAERWGATGFRAPATRRVWEVMPTLGFDYDSSYPDTDPFEPDGGGCCTWLPFFNGELVELPITLPQDHTIFTILQQTDEALWLLKADELRRRGGLALLITHPDYMLDSEPRDAYDRFLASLARDGTAWAALPREVSSWWRRRAASHIECIDGRWEIVGPAAGEGRVAFAPVYATPERVPASRGLM